MIRALIVEDEENAVNLLTNIINEYCPEIKILGSTSSYQDSLHFINENSIDLIFMDIQLKDCTAFDILDNLDEIKFHIVFTTAYNSHAIKAFEYGAVHYILKPYSPKSFLTVYDRVKSSLEPTANLERLKQELFDLVSGASKFISIPTNNGLHRIETSQIIRIEADRSYCTLHLINDENLTVSKSLREIESMLTGNQFYRTHTSHLVSIEKVRQYSNEDGGCVILSSGDRVPLSRRKKSHFLELIKS